jgi:RimJ/RimL family protein N-acetyltransferase
VVTDVPRIMTERLVLRGWDPDADLDAYAALCADPDVMRFIGDGSVQGRAACAERLSAFGHVWRTQGFGLFAVEVADGGELIGFTGLAIPDFLPEIMPAVEIGWRLARAHWGLGYATEAARAALTFGFDRVCLERIVSVHAVGNDASANVMRKIGMHLERQTIHPGNGRAVRVYAIERPSLAEGLQRAALIG